MNSHKEMLLDLQRDFDERARRWAQEAERPLILESDAHLQSPSDFAAGCRKAYAEAAAEIQALLQKRS